MLRLWRLGSLLPLPLLPWRLMAGRCGWEGRASWRVVALVELEELRVRRIHQGGGSLEGAGRVLDDVSVGCEGVGGAGVGIIVMGSSWVDFGCC
jgi:hypothetical protein